jgi:hypothetical protein
LAGGEGLRIPGTLTKLDYLERAARGGYPEVITRKTNRRTRWFESYITTIIHREIRNLSEIERIADLPRVLRLVAARTAGTMNIDALGRDTKVPSTTLRRYLALLQTAFLIHYVPAWSNNKTARASRSPKLFVVDSGLAVHLLGASPSGLAQPAGNAGQVLETFVAMELRRQLGWSRERATLHHLRTKEGLEVDAIIEAADGRVAGVEVKAAATVRSSDFAGLRYLANKAGDQFVCGVVLYAGQEPLSFGKNLFAAPISALWETV